MKTFKIFLSILLFHFVINNNKKKSEKNTKNPGFPDRASLEKQIKVLACTYLSTSVLSLYKNDNSFKDMLKNYDFLSSENVNAKDKISHFITVNCYTKISPETANKILLEIPKKGKLDFEHDKQYSELLKVNDLKKKENAEKFMKVLKEVNEILKEIKNEESIFNKNKKDDPNFEKNMKDFEEKMKKNYEKKRQENKKNTNKKTKQTAKKKRGNGKKPYNNTKWEIINVNDEKLLSLKDFFFNPVKFVNVTGINSIFGMLIMSLLTINLFQVVKNAKIDEKEEINVDELNKKENEEEEEEGGEEEGDDNENNVVENNVVENIVNENNANINDINENVNTPLGKKDDI